ncbi:helix-turn-helix domain-containing protein [Paenibacillus agricola]|uniref:Helix-turn-helix transcriptional regulator n=1 Tax=Paenibacillus agricola TaxID=2716264 RepID=A0ABX0JAU1_9BACL|nr:helix-turn-helix domain-containing protein [Paenibacillus agricola]NHN32688.1 helix-turn-helix transcriptional regulator [Paenibacillus agricola]
MPKYFKKLLLFSTVLVLLPIIIWGIYSYFQLSESIIKKFSLQNKQSLYQSHLKVEQVLETIDYLVTQYMLSPSFRFVDRSLGVPEFVEIRELLDGMLKLPVKRLGVESFVLLNKEKKWIISNEGFELFSQSDKPDVFEQYNNLPYTSMWTHNTADNKTIDLVKKIPILTNSNDPKGQIVMKLNKSKINDLLLQEVTFGDFYIFDQSLQLIVSNNTNTGKAKEIMALFGQKEIQMHGDMTIHIGNSDNMINYRKSAYNNWLYVSTFSMSDATSDLNKMARITILFCLLIVMVMSIIIIVGTRKMYNPIRKIFELSKRETNTNTGIGKDEFLYIEKRMDTLMKAQLKLSTQLESQTKYLSSSFLLKLLLGLVQSNELEKQEYMSQHSWKRLAVISLQIDSAEVRGYSERDRHLILFAMDNITLELVPPCQCIGTMVIDQTQVTILVGQQETEQEFKMHINRLANMIRNSIYSYLKIEVSIGIGGIYAEKNSISKSYKESLEALNYRIRLGSNVILHLDEIINPATHEFVYPQNLEEQLTYSIKMLDYTESKIILNQFLKEVTEKNMTYGEFQFVMLQLISSLTRIIHEQGQSIQEVTGKNVTVEHLFLLHSKDEICDWLYHSMIRPTIHFFENSRGTQSDNLTEAITQIIHNDFESGITLEYCAAQVNFHPSYVSRVFKKEMGISFSEYVDNHRLKMSEEWLIQTDMNISEISERFKYNSSAAFIRYFRKMKGMTPGEFRKRHQLAK